MSAHEVDALIVVHADDTLFEHRSVLERRTVLGHEQRGSGRCRVLVRHAAQQAGEPLGLHLPLHRSARQSPLVPEDARRRREGRVSGSLRGCVAAERRHHRRMTAHVLAVVVVHAERVDRRRDGFEVARQDGPLQSIHGRGIHPAEVGEHIGGVGGAEDRVEEPPVELSVDAAGSIGIGRIGRVDRVGDRHVERDAEMERRVPRAQRAHRLTVSEQQVVGGQHPLRLAVVPGRVQARGVAQECRAPRFVQRGPHLHPVAERIMHVECVLGEAVGGVADSPAAVLLQRLRKVPVVKGEPGQDAGIQQLVDEPLVEVDALEVERAAVGTHPRPRRREAVGLQSHRGHERHVVAVAVVVVARDITVVGVDHGAGNPAEGIPDRVGAPALVGGPFDLVRGGGRSEQEVGGELAR